jgi:hypothetical protein
VKKILGGLVAVTLVGATALATTTSAEARWGGWGGWGWGVGAFAAGAVIGSALTAPYYGYYTYAPGYSYGYAPAYTYGYAPAYSYGYAPAYYTPAYNYGYAPAYYRYW